MAAPVVRGVGAVAEAGSGDVTVPLPAGTVSGDGIYLLITTRDNIDLSSTGYVRGAGLPYRPNTTSQHDVVFKVAGTSEPNPVLTHTGGDGIEARALVIQAGTFDPANPFDAVVAVTNTDETIPALTTTVVDCLRVSLIGGRNDTNSITAVAGGGLTWTERFYDETNVGASDLCFAGWTAPDPAAGSVSGTYVLSLTTGWAIQFAIRPAAAGTTHQTVSWQSSYVVKDHATTTWQSSYTVNDHAQTTWASSYVTRARQTVTWASSYTTHDHVTTTWQSTYVARARAAVSWASSYVVNARVTTTWASNYNVQTPGATHETRAWESSWTTRARVTTTWASSYGVAGSAALAWQSSYTVRVRVQTSWQSSYAVAHRDSRAWTSSYLVSAHLTSTWVSSYTIVSGSAPELEPVPAGLHARPFITRADGPRTGHVHGPQIGSGTKKGVSF